MMRPRMTALGSTRVRSRACVQISGSALSAGLRELARLAPKFEPSPRRACRAFATARWPGLPYSNASS